MKMDSQDTFVKLENRPIKCEYESDDNFESPQQTYPIVSSIPKEILGSNDVRNQVKPEKEFKTLPQERVDTISDNSIYPAELIKKEKVEYDGTVIEYVGNAVKSGQEQYEIVTQFDDEKVSQYTVVLSSEYPKQGEDETNLPSVSVASASNVENSIIQNIKKEPELDISMEEKYDIYMEDNDFDDFDEFDYDDDKSQIQTSATSLKCPGCPFESLVREVLAKHLVDEHIDGKMCKLCNLEFEDSVAQHCSKHLPEAQTSKRAAGNSEILECTICSIMFPFRSEYIRHIKTTHSFESWDKNELQCEVCLESFETKYQLARHYRTHPDLKPFNCNMCSKIFRFRFSLNKHIELRHTGSRPRPFECKICSKKFTTKFSLMDHVRRHTGEVPFKCEICSKAFLHNNELKTHLVLMHDINDKKYFKCEICSKIFWRQNPYMEHMRSHSGAEPFKCEFCSKIFELSRNLEKHVKICQRTYSCDMCSKKLTTKFGLDAHMRLHTGERPFKCEFCGKTFRYKNNLKIHMAQNHDITDKCCLTCTRCSKVFRNKAYYERHMRVHTGERPYRCEICKMTFGCRSTMKRHTMNIHTDPDQQVREKPTTTTTTGNMKRIKDIGADEDSVEEKVTKKKGN